MATFLTVNKSPLSWTAPPPEDRTKPAVELLISDDYKLDIGSGYNLTIQPATAEVQWTEVTRSNGGHVWPGTYTGADQFLNIGDGYNLLISDDYKLIIDPDRSETPWTPVTRNPAQY